ncbi:diguanylate cyclase (GGDEF)-like protein [Rhizobium mongolense USDA 1844]|uniref:Diguanylate cyclase (GGDEF)-like protein n=1 Tax=Rhizobium mongolense USDA 1844 TaxID=1079460 RepID=A0A559TEE9_9HYPH|nr:diguanylate cyclase (GGDEF)-like protein [Rhizobium mongolense USDA 1844]
MNFVNRYSPAIIKPALLLAAIGASCCLAGSVGLLLVLNMLLPDQPFLAGFVSIIVVSLVVAFPLLLALQLRNAELAALHANIDHTARHDPVTNALTATAFAAAMQNYADRRRKIATDAGGIMIAVVVETLDTISRRYGPQWADTVMLSLSDIIKTSVRSGDLVARLASNELGIFLPGASPENAQEIGARIRRRVSQAAFETEEAPLDLKLKLGGALFEGAEDFNRIRQLAGEVAFDSGTEDGEPIAIAKLPAA